MKTKTPDHKEQETNKAIGQLIRFYRMLRGFSQERLGDKIGVTFQQVQKYENGSNRVSFTRAMMISDALNIPLMNLVPEGNIELSKEFGISSRALSIAAKLNEINDPEIYRSVSTLINKLH